MRRLMSALLMAGLFTATVSAQLIVNPIGKAGVGQIEVGGAAAFSTIEYDGGADIERLMMGGYAAFGLNEMLDVYGSLAYSFKAEPDNSSGVDGSGFVCSGGARAMVFTQKPFSVHAYAMAQYWMETYEYGSTDVDVTGLEIGGGALVAFEVSPELNVYGGLELIPYSDGESDPGNADVERDGIFSLRGGATFSMGNLMLRGEVAVGSETAIIAGASIAL